MLHLDVHPVDQFLGQLVASAGTQAERRLAERLRYLLTAYRDEQDGASYSLPSLKGLLEFLRQAPGLAYPAVTVTPEGLLYATWKQPPDKVFSVEFMDEQQVRFVVIRPHTSYVTGTSTGDKLLATATRLQVMDWAGV
jgi:hypothetical protein